MHACNIIIVQACTVAFVHARNMIKIHSFIKTEASKSNARWTQAKRYKKRWSFPRQNNSLLQDCVFLDIEVTLFFWNHQEARRLWGCEPPNDDATVCRVTQVLRMVARTSDSNMCAWCQAAMQHEPYVQLRLGWPIVLSFGCVERHLEATYAHSLKYASSPRDPNDVCIKNWSKAYSCPVHFARFHSLTFAEHKISSTASTIIILSFSSLHVEPRGKTTSILPCLRQSPVGKRLYKTNFFSWWVPVDTIILRSRLLWSLASSGTTP